MIEFDLKDLKYVLFFADGNLVEKLHCGEIV
jgi:hypothetical protein